MRHIFFRECTVGESTYFSCVEFQPVSTCRESKAGVKLR